MSATATRPRRDPRLSARRAAVVRAAGQRRLTVLAVVAIVVALGLTGIVLLHSSLFSARHVSVLGNAHTSTAAIERAGGLVTHPALIDVGSANARAITSLPWIATATIARHFPDSLTVRVTERTPVARAALPGGGSALLDASGRVLADLGRGHRPPSGLLALAGLGAMPAPGHEVHGAAFAVVRAADALPTSLLKTVTGLAADPRLGLVVDLTGGAVAELGTGSELAEKYAALATLLAHGAVTGAARVDLRVPSSPVLNP